MTDVTDKSGERSPVFEINAAIGFCENAKKLMALRRPGAAHELQRARDVLYKALTSIEGM